MKKLFTILILASSYALQPLFAQHQELTDKVDMADALRQDGKIYVVVAVVAIIFAGLLLYVFSLDKKIGKLEKEIKGKP